VLVRDPFAAEGASEALVEVIVPRLRLACPHCGPKLEGLDWLAPYARVTNRLATSVARLCQVMSIRHVAQFYRLSWTTVKLIDWRHLERALGPVDLDGVTIIGMDEFAIQKGHRYATVVVEPNVELRGAEPLFGEASPRTQG
jgi:transposase